MTAASHLVSGDGQAAGEVLQYTRDPVIAICATLLSASYRSTFTYEILPTGSARTIIDSQGGRSHAPGTATCVSSGVPGPPLPPFPDGSIS